MINEEEGVGGEAAALGLGGGEGKERGAYAERRETGPAIASPPSSKYLKQPVLRTSRFSSVLERVSERSKYERE